MHFTCMKPHLPLAAALALAACSPAPDDANQATPAPTPVAEASATPSPAASPSAAPADKIVTADGYDTIRIGAAPASATGYDLAAGNDPPGDCRTYTSKQLPNAHVMVIAGTIRRITFSAPDSGASPYRTEGGVAPGASEAEVRKAHGALQEEPHKYVEAPAKYLTTGTETAPGGIRFEIDKDGRAQHIHVGQNPWLRYVEGCS